MLAFFHLMHLNQLVSENMLNLSCLWKLYINYMQESQNLIFVIAGLCGAAVV